jgi:VIT1/CCC1 family predicted Fe2+/Mn2+ transporter
MARLADYIGKFWAGAEVMYGVIIAMTFTSMLRGFPVVLEIILNKVILAALFCCIAWGIADGLFYLWERNYIIRRENRVIGFSKSPQQNESALSLIGEQLDDTILRNIPEENRLQLYEKLVQFLSGVHTREKLAPRQALTIVIGTFLLSAGAGMVVVFPFFIIPEVQKALVVSNLSGIFLLFGVGYFRAFDRDLFSKVLFGLGSSMVGIIIAAITVVFGG